MQRTVCLATTLVLLGATLSAPRAVAEDTGTGIRWASSFPDALARARVEGKLVLADFSMDT